MFRVGLYYKQKLLYLPKVPAMSLIFCGKSVQPTCAMPYFAVLLVHRIESGTLLCEFTYFMH